MLKEMGLLKSSDAFFFFDIFNKKKAVFMFNIGFKISKIFDSQEFTGSGEKLIKQDIIVDICFHKSIVKGVFNETEKTTAILLSLFGDKIRSCDFKLGDYGTIVGSFSQLGNGVYKHLNLLRFKNPSFNLAYQKNVGKVPTEDFGKTSFEFVLSELHRYRLAGRRFILQEFAFEIDRKLEDLIQFDETSRVGLVCFYKELPSIIMSTFADVELLNYLSSNGLNILELLAWHKSMDFTNNLNNNSDYLLLVEDVHYNFLGLTRLEIQRKRLERNYISFLSHEIRWFDFKNPLKFGDSDLLNAIDYSIKPDSIELELDNFRKVNNILDEVKDESQLNNLTFAEYEEWCYENHINHDLSEAMYDISNSDDLSLENPFDNDDELDEWNGYRRPDY
jgi:hypothetical protein